MIKSLVGTIVETLTYGLILTKSCFRKKQYFLRSSTQQKKIHNSVKDACL